MRLFSRFLAAALLFAAGTAHAADYEVMAVTTEKIGGKVTVGGTVVPFKEVTLSAQIPGEITTLAGREGDGFEKGTILVAIDDAQLQAQRRAALAQIYNAEAALRNAQVQYSRELWSPQSNNINRMPGMGMPAMFDQFFTRNLNNAAGMSNTWLDRQADLYGQVSGVNQARSSLLQAKAQVETIDAKLRDASLVSPFDGVIVQKLVEIGDTVQPGQPLLQFAFVKYLRIRAEVPSRLTENLSKGTLIPARLDVHGAEIMARVSQIYPMADASRHTVTVKFDLPIKTSGQPGMYAEVDIPDPNSRARNTPVVPEKALVWRGSLPGVFVKDGGKLSLRLVRLGAPVGGGKVSVLAGLKNGDLVVVSPPAGLASSSAVEIKR